MSDTLTWADPILFDGATGPEIEADFLPSPFSEFAANLAATTETPQSMASLMVLGIISMILARKYRVVIDRSHSESLNLYIFIAMEPGNRKSGVFKMILAPVTEWESNEATRLKSSIELAKSEYETLQAIIHKLRKSAKYDNATEVVEKIKQLEGKLPSIPVTPQLFVTDATAESLRSKLAIHNGYMGIVSDEGGIIDVIAGLYNNGSANIDLFLKGIEGGYVRVIRAQEDIQITPFLTFVLAAQPAVLESMASQKSFSGRGLLERFLYCVPQSSLGYRTHDTAPLPLEVIEQYEGAVTNLLRIPDNIVDGKIVQRSLYAENMAFAMWRVFRLAVEEMMRPGGKLYHCKGWCSKLSGFVFRMAGILYVAKNHAQITELQDIDSDSMSKAISLGYKLIEHAAITFKDMAWDQKTRDAQSLWRWMLDQNKPSLRLAEITYGVKNRNSGKAEINEGLLEVLVERNLIRKRQEKTSGRPVTIYEINPKCLSPV